MVLKTVEPSEHDVNAKAAELEAIAQLKPAEGQTKAEVSQDAKDYYHQEAKNQLTHAKFVAGEAGVSEEELEKEKPTDPAKVNINRAVDNQRQFETSNTLEAVDEDDAKNAEDHAQE